MQDQLLQRLTVSPFSRPVAHAGTAEVAAWSPGGRYLAAGYSSGAVLVWDVARRRLAYGAWRAHRRFVNALAWSPDGRFLVSAAPDGTAVLWHWTPGHTLARLRTLRWRPQPPYVPAVAFAPGGATLAVADGRQTVTLWRVAALARGQRSAARPSQRWHVAGHTTALAWSPDGTRLAVGTLEGRLLVYRAPGYRAGPVRVLGSPVWALAWSPDASTLAAGGADGVVRLLTGAHLQPWRLLLAPFHQAPVLKVPDFGAAGTQPSAPRLAAGAAINALGWSAGGNLLAVSATGVPVRLWQPSRGRVVSTYRDNWDMNAVAWRPDGTLLAVAADDGSVILLRPALPAPAVTDSLCYLGLQRWCASLLGQPRHPSATRMTPPSYMSR